MTEHEELLFLRALAERQEQELEASKRLLEERDEKIRKQNIQIENMIQALLHARKKLYGPSTEVTGQVEVQFSFFEMLLFIFFAGHTVRTVTCSQPLLQFLIYPHHPKPPQQNKYITDTADVSECFRAWCYCVLVL